MSKVCLVSTIGTDFKEHATVKIYHTFLHWGVEYVIGTVPFVGDRGVVLDP